MKTLKVAFVGLGYVGLATAVCFAYKGFKVLGVDVDEEKVRKINRGTSPVMEPKLDKLLKSVLSKKSFEASADTFQTASADVVFITVGTPSRDDGSIDLSYVAEASEEIGAALKKRKRPQTVVVKSTVLPGTTRTLVKDNLEQASGKLVGKEINLCVNPEFLREGSAVDDTFKPDRVVIGDDWGRGAKVLRKLYQRFYRASPPPFLQTNTVNAEMIKYASNFFLAAKVSLINEVANICQRTPSADVEVVAKGVGMDRRIGPLFLKAGLGYGGSCFPKDVRALISYAKQKNYSPILLEAVENLNNKQPFVAIELAEKMAGPLKGKTAAILGLSFKPNTDDIREAVSLKIIDKLLDEGCLVRVYDPAAMENVRRIYGDKLVYAENATKCLESADFCIVATEWDEFRKLRPKDFHTRMKTPIVVDGRRIYDPENFSKLLLYNAVGLGPSSS